MSALTLTLQQKALRVEVSPETQQQRLSFMATLPSQDSLRTHHGVEIKNGFVEFVFGRPRLAEPTLLFVEATIDPDTGKTFPESFSFYALLSSDLFNTLRDAPSSATVTLHLKFELMGTIQFGDPLGFEKIWHTESQKSVPVQYFDFVVSYPESNV